MSITNDQLAQVPTADMYRMPPGENMDDFCTMLWSGMFGLKWKLSDEGKKRFFNEFLPLLHDTKHEVLGTDDSNSWYLVYIGTKTAARGKGYAKALIEHTTRQVNRPSPQDQTQTYTWEIFRCTCYVVSTTNIHPFQADKENRTCYLESSNTLNLKLYGRLGFQFAKKIFLKRGEKPVGLDIMTRPPVAEQLAGKTVGFGALQAGM